LPTSETNWDRSASIDWQRTLVVQDTVHIADVIIMGKLGNGEFRCVNNSLCIWDLVSSLKLEKMFIF